MELCKNVGHVLPNADETQGQPETMKLDQQNLFFYTEKISKESRYPHLTLRIFIYVISHMEVGGWLNINARQLARKLDANYATITKCLKYLRETGVLQIER